MKHKINNKKSQVRITGFIFAILMFVILISFLQTISAAATIYNFSLEDGNLNNNTVFSAFFYDTSTDRLSDSWRNDSTKSWITNPWM